MGKIVFFIILSIALLGILDLYEDASAANIPTTPIIFTRGHFNLDTGALINPSPTSYDTSGDIPGLEVGGCPDNLVVYVHGWDNTPDSAIEKFNIAKKSFVFNGFTEPVVGFSWDSDTGLLDFDDAKLIAEQNGLKLGQFVLDFKNACSNSDIRLVGHSLGPRVIFFTLTSLNGNAQWNNQNYQIASVHLLGAAVDNEFVSMNPVDGKGIAVEAVACEFHNKFNSEDDILEFFYVVEEFDFALGEDGAEQGIPLPQNYNEQNVRLEISRDTDGDGNNDLPNLGDDHFGYAGVVNAADVLTSDGAMDIVVNEFISEKTWDGGGNDGIWSNPLNWSCDTLPKSSDDITINASIEPDNTVHLNTNFVLTTGSVTVEGGIVRVDSGNTLSSSSGDTITVNAGSFLTIEGTLENLSNGKIDIFGTIKFTGVLNNAGIINIHPNGLLVSTGAGVLNNNAGGTITNLADGIIANLQGATINNNSGDTISNSGIVLNTDNGSTINNNGPGKITNNNGGIILNTATSTIENNAGGTITNEAGGILVNDGEGTINNNSGDTLSNSGIFVNQGDSTINNNGPGKITNNDGGIIFNTGNSVIRNNAGATLTNEVGGIIGNEDGAILANRQGGTLNNNSGDSITNSAIFINKDIGSTINNNGPGKITNQPGGIFINQEDATLNSVGGGSLTNLAGGIILNRLNGFAFNGVGSTIDNNVDGIFSTSTGTWQNECNGTVINNGILLGTIVDLPCGPISDPVIMAAGDISCEPGNPAFNNGQGTADACRQLHTSDIIVSADPDAALLLGDSQYFVGDISEYFGSYDSSWGRVKSITKPSPGNHEYFTPAAVGYYDYFGTTAGDPTKGYYSYNLGSWHLISLNSNCIDVGGCDPGSPQAIWLENDLLSNPADCTLAYWHQPRFSSGSHGDDVTYDEFWNLLHQNNADVVLVGHDHNYERFAPQDPDANPDAQGIRQFVVGTGGKDLRPINILKANSEVFESETFGVLKLTLHQTSYDWDFIPEAGETFMDSGTANCN